MPALGQAALEAPKDLPARASLAGQLLVATPSMGDPRFAQTVILMARHDKNGAFGIVINKPLGERPLARLLTALGEKDAGRGRSGPGSQRKKTSIASSPSAAPGSGTRR